MNSRVKRLTLIELLCIIVILVVLSIMAIFCIYKLMSKSNLNLMTQQEKKLISISKKYVKNNNEYLPNDVGEAKVITLNQLKNDKYLKDDILDSYGNSCMNESYVRIYKFSKNEYSYLPYLYCGTDKKDIVEIIPKPTIEIYYTDFNDNILENNNIKNIKETKFNINLSGGLTTNYNKLDLVNYSYSIFIYYNNEYLEIYNSQVIDANESEDLFVSKKFNEYLNENFSKLKIKVTATNNIGGYLEYTNYIN